MKKKKIKVVILQPGGVPYCTEITNTLGNLQHIVGGYIETHTGKACGAPVVAVCNEMGIPDDLPWCCLWNGLNFFGTVIWCGIDGDDLADIPVEFVNLNVQNAGGCDESKR